MFKRLIKESIKEALKEERYLLYDTLIPSVGAKEQAEIESRYGSPDNYDENEFEDVTEWVLS
ncbi:MAG: hypothetical protein GY950_01635 [bacterium]|nr:hypothetical protein [bacterium]